MQQIFKALQYASIKHKGQIRKGRDRAAYINHPIAVANTIINVGKIEDENTIIAALLHDVIEDTDTTEQDISEAFNSEIAQIVLEVSDDKHLSIEERKALQIKNAPHLSDEAKIIRVADKICNIRDVIDFPPITWNKKRKIIYLNWTRNIVDQIRNTNISLETLFDKYYTEGISKIS